MNKSQAWSVIIGVVLVGSLGARADYRNEIEEAEVQRMKTALSGRALSQVRRGFSQLRALVGACEIQLAEKRVPDTCFLAIRKARDLQLEHPLMFPLARINSECHRLAERTEQLDWPRESELTTSCRTIARAKILKNRYKAGMSLE
jgi:hypothetical protein